MNINFSDSIRSLASRASSAIFISLGQKKETEAPTQIPKELPTQQTFMQRFKSQYLDYAKCAILFNIEPERALLTAVKENIEKIKDYRRGVKGSEDIPHIIESGLQTAIAGTIFAIGAPGYHFFMPVFTPLLLIASIIPAGIKAYRDEASAPNPLEMEQAIEALETRAGLEEWEKSHPKNKSKP